MVFNKLPQNYQFYARDSINMAYVPLKGIIEIENWSYFSVIITKEGKPYKYVKSNFNYSPNNKSLGSFSLVMPLKCELAEYEMKFYAVRNSSDSVLMATRTNLVVGDAFVVSGQSNSYNHFETSYAYKGKYTRSLGRFYSDYANYETYQEKDTLWSVANESSPVGEWAGEIMKLIIEENKIPVCIINGGSGGSSMAYNLYRNPDNPYDLSTSSGRLLYRVDKAGLRNSIKAFIYRQGENEANNYGINTWKEQFLKHVEFIKREYPSIQKIYLPQINVINGVLSVSGTIRENQRSLVTNDGFIKGFATVGLPGHDGVHYNFIGAKQAALELYRILAEDFYQSIRKIENYSPNVKNIYFLNKEKTKVAIEFDSGQKIQTPKDTLLTTIDRSPMIKKVYESIYFNKLGYPAESSGSVNISKIVGLNNYLVLELSSPPTIDVMSYLPAFAPENYSIVPFSGPYLKNKLGMRAFAFENISIQPYKVNQNVDLDNDGIIDDLDDCPLIINPLKPLIQESNNMRISVSTGASFQWYLNGEEIAGATNQSFNVLKTGNYSVRVKDQNGCKSPISDNYQVIITQNQDENSSIIYPNPANNWIIIKFSNQFGNNCFLEIFDKMGKRIFFKSHVLNGELLNIETLKSESYIIRLTSDLGQILNQKLIKIE